MLTLVRSVERKNRAVHEGVRHLLKPFAYQYSSERGSVASGLDLDRTHITISDVAASEWILKAQDYDPAELPRNVGFDLTSGGTQVVLTEMGSMFFNVFLGVDNQEEWLADLDASLANPALHIHLTLAGSCRSGDVQNLRDWLDGDRLASDTYWDRVPDLSLVRTSQ